MAKLISNLKDQTQKAKQVDRATGSSLPKKYQGKDEEAPKTFNGQLNNVDIGLRKSMVWEYRNNSKEKLPISSCLPSETSPTKIPCNLVGLHAADDTIQPLLHITDCSITHICPQGRKVMHYYYDMGENTSTATY